MFTIGKQQIGHQQPCFIIGEVAQAHDGSLGFAHAYIDAIADAGAHAAKFQTHIASEETTPHEPFRVKFSQQDATRYDYWQRMEFTSEQWAGLAKHCQDRNIVFLSSPFSNRAVDLLANLGMPAYKIASGEISNLPLLEHITRKQKPILLSSGMSSWKDLDEAVSLCEVNRSDYAILQCTTKYPTPPEEVGLNIMQDIRDKYGCPVGLSDHSGAIYAGLAAVTMGASILEIHVTMSREMFGPDVPASLTTQELRQLVEGTQFIETAMQHRVDKDRVAEEMQPLRNIFSKSLVARQDLPEGTVLGADHIAIKKPGTGIPAKEFPNIIGRVLNQSVQYDEILTYDHLR